MSNPYPEFKGEVKPPLLLQSYPDKPEPGSVGVVFVGWEASELTTRCLLRTLSLTASDQDCKGIVVVDNASEDGFSEEALQAVRIYGEGREDFAKYDTHMPPVTYLRFDENKYWSAAVNTGIRLLPNCEIVVTINGDAEPKSEDWLEYFRKELPGGAAAGMVDDGLDAKGLLERLADVVGPEFTLQKDFLADVVTSETKAQRVQHWCVAVWRNIYEELGLYLETGPFQQWWSDLEFCARIGAHGYPFKNMTPDVHHWHEVCRLYRERPELYQRLIRDLGDPELEQLYLERGRPLWETL